MKLFQAALLRFSNGQSRHAVAPGYRLLRAGDLESLRALFPRLLSLDGKPPPALTAPALEKLLHAFDWILSHNEPGSFAPMRALLDRISSNPGRSPFKRGTKPWEIVESLKLSKEPHDRVSYLMLMRALYRAWYSLPESWGEIGYPGPARLEAEVRP